MFTKYLLVVSGEIDIRNYRNLILHVLENTDFRLDLLFSSGPLDVLDHSSDTFSLGGKLGIDGTIKMEGEWIGNHGLNTNDTNEVGYQKRSPSGEKYLNLLEEIQIAVVALNQSADPLAVEKSKERFRKENFIGILRLILAVDHNVDAYDLHTVAWQVLGNSDPKRDIDYISDSIIYIDGTAKAFRKEGFPRRWPNIVCSSEETIKNTDQKWNSLGIGHLIPSPSLKYSLLSYPGKDEVMVPEG